MWESCTEWKDEGVGKSQDTLTSLPQYLNLTALGARS